MGVIAALAQRDSSSNGTNDDDGKNKHGIPPHALIVIGVLVPLGLLLGGLLFFVWRTERRRRATPTEIEKTQTLNPQDSLRGRRFLRNSRLINPFASSRLEPHPTEGENKTTSELEDTSLQSKLPETSTSISETQDPSSIHPALREKSRSRLPALQKRWLDAAAAAKKQFRHSMTEVPDPESNESRQSTTPNNFRHTFTGSLRYSAATIPSSWHFSLQSTRLAGNLASKRDRQTMETASSRYSEPERPTTMETAATRHQSRHSAIQEVDDRSVHSQSATLYDSASPGGL